MTRPCRIDGCQSDARTGRHICDMHRTRITRYGDPHHTTWKTADDHDITTVVREQRPTPGLTRLERLKVARSLTQRQLPAEQIARIVGVAPRTVYRWRSQGFRQAA